MTSEESPDTAPGFRWNWVFLSMLVYLIFYFLPLMSVPGGIIAGGVANDISMYVLGVWGTAGVFIISAVLAYYSPGITVWEVVVSALGVVILMVVLVSLETNRMILETTGDIVGFMVMLLVVFAMAYMGGWWGERLQNLKEIAEEYPMEMEGLEEEELGEEERKE